MLSRWEPSCELTVPVGFVTPYPTSPIELGVLSGKVQNASLWSHKSCFDTSFFRHVCKYVHEIYPTLDVSPSAHREVFVFIHHTERTKRWYSVLLRAGEPFLAAGWRAVTGPSSSSQPVNLSRADRYVWTGHLTSQHNNKGMTFGKVRLLPSFLTIYIPQCTDCVFTEAFCYADEFWFGYS